MFSRERIREPDFGQAAEQLAQRAGAAFGGVIRREEFEETVSDCRLLFIQNCIGSAVDQDFGRDHASQRGYFAVQFQSIGHRQGVRVAGDGDDVFGAEDVGLLEDLAADFG
jgi:hypothetical protein